MYCAFLGAASLLIPEAVSWQGQSYISAFI